MKLYRFKRDFYCDVEEGIKKTNATFLLGPRKCGKTVCLKQLAHEYKNAKYVNFKTLDEDESMEIFETIIRLIKEDEHVIYLLDEITYAFKPEHEINKIAEVLSEVENKNTKIVFTGSQSVALESWGNRAFCGNASFIRTNFLTFKEWLAYKGMEEVSGDSYKKFLFEVKDFYRFTSLKDYLQGCLEETVISNYKTNNIIFNNDVSLLNVDILLDVLYSTLITRQNKTTPQVFANKNQLRDDLKYFFRNAYNEIGKEEISDRIAQVISERYTTLSSTNVSTLKQALLFLYRCDLITLTYVSENVENNINIKTDLFSSENRIDYKADLFKNIICIKYPMFYIEILKEILKDKMPGEIPNDILGGIVECHVRGILPDTNCFEYHDIQDREVDYVNLAKQVGIEITVANKKNQKVHFDCLPECYRNILLTKDISDFNNGILRIPYYEFIYNELPGLDLMLSKYDLARSPGEETRSVFESGSE